MRWNIAAILGAAMLALFIGAFSAGVSVVEVTPPPATSTLAVIPQVTLPSLALPSIDEVASTTKTQSPAPSAKSSAGSTSSAAALSPAPVSNTSTEQPTSGGDLSAPADALRAALVNIICIVPEGGVVRSISGSGVIVSSSGMILTNSHVAQYFLLADRGVSCTIRTGSPAASAYYAELAFISPSWIAANPNVLEEATPSGTGEDDFAVLAIDGAASGMPLPASFPFVPLAAEAPAMGEQVVIGSYAAQFLQTSAIESSLFPTIVYGSIQDVFTFATSTIDVVSLGGSAAAQEGSSGGGVIDANGDLVATITTSTTEGDTSSRNLNAITASYIRREYATESDSSLASLLTESPSTAISDFAPQIPHLESIITASLPD